MPARRRGQEAKRAERRRVRAQALVPAPLTREQEIERAYDQDRLDACCPDCSPRYFENLPEVVEHDAKQEVEDYLASRED